MADTAYERFKKDEELSKPQKKEPGTINTINEVQESFLKALEAIGEPKKPVKYLRPLNIFQKEDKSLARFILAASPELKIYVDKKLSEKHGKPIDSIKFSEDAEEKDYISILDEVRKGVDTGAYDLSLGLKETLFTGSDYFLVQSF